jgi:hypothetical protein
LKSGAVVFAFKKTIVLIYGASALVSPSLAIAQSFTVQGGQTSGNLMMANPNDVGIVLPQGTVSAVTDGVDAVDMANDNQSFLNSEGGLVSQSGNFSAAVFSDFLNGDIQNAGIIAASGTATFGIVSLGDSARIGNSGHIETSGQAGIGILSAGSGAAISNAGLIRSSGQAGFGVILDGPNGVFANSGAVETSDVISSAILIGDNGDGVRVTNAGRIISPLDNSAEAIGIGLGAYGVTLNLLAGGLVQGAINFGGTNGTINIGPGLNTALTFNLFNTVTLNTGNSPYATSGGLLAVVDTTGFAANDDMLSDLTGSIANSIDNQISNALRGRKAWMRGFSGYRAVSADDQWIGFENLFGGVMVGIEDDSRYASRGGLFFGTSRGVFETDTKSQKIESADYFGGLYGNFKGRNSFANLALTVGRSHFESERRVANNFVTGGIEHAAADYDGTFISPQLKVGTEMALSNVMLRPSLRGRYAHIQLDANSESGSAADLSVSERYVSMFGLRGELAFVSYPITLLNGTLQYSFRVGVDGSIRNNPDVNGSLLGQPIALAAGGKNRFIQGYVGFDTQYALPNGWLIQSETNMGVGSDDAVTVMGNVGLNIPL